MKWGGGGVEDEDSASNKIIFFFLAPWWYGSDLPELVVVDKERDRTHLAQVDINKISSRL